MNFVQQAIYKLSFDHLAICQKIKISDVEENDFIDFLTQEDVIRNSIDTIRVRLKMWTTTAM